MNNKQNYIGFVQGLLQSLLIDLLLYFMWYFFIVPHIEVNFKVQLMIVIILLILPLYKINEGLSIYWLVKKSEKELIKEKKRHVLEDEKVKYKKLLSKIKRLNETESYETVLNYINTNLNGADYQTTQYSDCDCLNSIIDYYKTETKSSDIEFEVSVPESIHEPFVKHNISQKVVSTIIGNFMDNAIESLMTSPKACHKISLEIRCEQYITLKVSNNGKKIPDINKVFEAQYSTKGENRGLGLVVVERMVERINGTINVKSNDEKTSFEVVV